MSWLINANSQGLTAPVDTCVPDPTKPMSVSFAFYANFNPATDTSNRILASFKVLSGGFNNFFRVMKGSDKKWSVGFLINGASSLNLSSAVVSFTQSAWHRVCVTWGPGTATKLYLDGSLVSLASSSHPSASYSGTGSTSMAWSFLSWFDSAAYGLPANCYGGEFAIFNETLSASQAAALAAGRSPYSIGASVLSYEPFKDTNTTDLQTGAPGALGTAGAWTGTGLSVAANSSILHPTVDSPWSAVVKRTAQPGASKYIERLIEWGKQETSPYVYSLDLAAGTTTVGNSTGTTPLVVSGATLGTNGILPGDRRTCASFDGTDDYATIAHEAGNNYERTDTFAFSATIHLDQNLADGEYAIVSKTSALVAFLGVEWYVTVASGLANLGCRVSDGTRTITAATDSGTVPLGTPVHVGFCYDGTSANTALQLFISGDRISVAASGTTLSSTIQNLADVQIGRQLLLAAGQYFKGRIASVSMWKPSLATDALKIKFYSRMKSLATLALNDVPDLYVKDAQGNVHRPGDPGYRPNVIADMDMDDDYGDPFAAEMLGQYSDAGLLNLKALLVTPRKGHTTAAGVAAAIKRTRNLGCPIGVYQGNDIGSSTSSGFAAAVIADASLLGGSPSANASYPTNVAACIAALTPIPDKSAVLYMGGHARGMEAIRSDATAWALFQAKVSHVVAMFGAYQPNTSTIDVFLPGMLWHSDNFDGIGGDAEYNVAMNGGATTADTDATSFADFFAALDAAGIPVVVHGWNFAVRSAVNAPSHGKAYSLLTSGSVSKVAEADETTAGTGRSPWDAYCPWIIAHGLSRSVNGGGPEWLGRGSLGFNTDVDDPYAPAAGSWNAGYTRFEVTPKANNVWVAWFDDGTTGDRIGQLLCDHMDRFITAGGATGSAIVGDRTSGAGNNMWLARNPSP